VNYAAIVSILHEFWNESVKSLTRSVTSLAGIRMSFRSSVSKDGFERNAFEQQISRGIVAIVGNSTCEVLQAKKSLKAVCVEIAP